ncbi:MAG: amidohydrolase [Rhodococcus sp. (in: high G+C Gram-positive bacteria)]|nr:MAG: amidohydrolase [Rhodococcus sp. (in: high G+C Gram-positive bacteria)]
MTTQTSPPTTGRTALTGVRVFDGQELSAPRTVVIDGSVIGTDPAGARIVDAGGAVLLPGLIDAHIHLNGLDTLEQLCSWGVTTGLDMATWPPALVSSLRGVDGLTDIRSPGIPVIGPAGPHAHFGMPAEAVVPDWEAAGRFVSARVVEGADYIKIVLEAPGDGGPDPVVAGAVVEAAHRHGKPVVAHASSRGAYALALEAGADIVTHIPNGEPLGDDMVARMLAGRRVAVPPLSMMQALAALHGSADAFAAASDSVAALYRAGVPVLAGTDAALQPGLPQLVVHGESLHHELELLVAAGLSTVDALRAATVLPARHFGLGDRGAVEPGLRADLVLVDDDPLTDIRATRTIERIWCGGVEHTPAPALRSTTPPAATDRTTSA